MSTEIGTLLPGESLVYATTESLAHDREFMRTRAAATSIAVADAVWKMALAGRVDLLQRRVASGFQYIAIRRRETDKQPVQPLQAGRGRGKADQSSMKGNSVVLGARRRH